MLKSFVKLGIAMLLISRCSFPEKESTSSDYYDFDSLINEQLVRLIELNPKVDKTVRINGLEESSSIPLDSVGWVEEFQQLRDYDISSPKYINAFSSKKESTTLSFTRLELGSGLQSLMISEIGDVTTIEGKIKEKTSIYDNSQMLKITIMNGLISSIDLTGTQKMILLDTTRYQSVLRISE